MSQNKQRRPGEGGIADRQLDSDNSHQNGARWLVHRLNSVEALLAAMVHYAWFPPWVRALRLGKIACIHCGRNPGFDAALIGALDQGDNQLVTFTTCRRCTECAGDFDSAARAAINAAEAGMLSKGRSFKHGVPGWDTVQ